MKVLMIALSLFTSAAASAAEPVEITQLSSSASSYFGGTPEIEYSYNSGGCSADNAKVTYKVELLKKDVRVSASGYKFISARVKLRIFEESSGPCRMAFIIRKKINTRELMAQHADELGLNLQEPQSVTSLNVELPPVVGFASIQNN